MLENEQEKGYSISSTGKEKTSLVSVVVPTFNRVKLLSETIKSILSQTFDDFELLIIDNMSEDGTEQYVKALGDSRIKYFRNANNGIIAVNRNLGISKANGKYIAFCDDDDLWFPEKLENQLKIFPKDGISCVATNYIPIGDTVYCRNHLSFGTKEIYRDYSYEEIALANPVLTSSLLTRKINFLQDGEFDENPDFRFIEDWDLWLRMSKRGRIRVLSKPLIQYRVVRTKSRDVRGVTLRTLKIFEKHYALGYLDKKMLPAAMGNCFVSIGKAFLDMNDRIGIEYYKEGLRYSRGFQNKIRSLAGILLFYLPYSLRTFLVEAYYRFQARLTIAHHFYV